MVFDKFVVTKQGVNNGWIYMHRGGWVKNPESRYLPPEDYTPATADELAAATASGDFVVKKFEQTHVGGILYNEVEVTE